MNEIMFKVWVDKYSGMSNPEMIAKCKKVFAAVPGIDEVLRRAVTSRLSMNDVMPLVDAAMAKGTSAPAPVPQPVVAAPVPVVERAQAVLAQATPAKKSLLQKAQDKLKGVWPNKKAVNPAAAAASGSKKVMPKMVLVGIGAGVLVLVVVIIIAVLNMTGRTPGNADIVLDTAVPESTGTASENISTTKASTEQSFWSNLRNAEVPELSPGNLGGQLNAKTSVGIFLMIILTLWGIGEGSIRKKGQNGSLFFTVLAVVTGWITMPILMLIANAHPVGWFVLGVLVLAILWALTASTIKSQSDLSPITVALGIFTASLFYVGKLAVITTIGGLFGATWAAWANVTSLGGVLTLLMSGRAALAWLTLLIFVLGLVVIFMAGREVGKNHGRWAALAIGVFIVALFMLSNWGLSYGAGWLISNNNLPITVQVVLKVIAPILAWFIALFAAVGIGVAMGDVEVGWTENKQKIGLGKTGTFAQNIADFGILGTVIPLFLGVIMIL